jgi:hypothetical protein
MDRCYEILSWPPAGLNPLRRSMQMQVIRILLPIGIKALLDGKLGRGAARERNRAAVLEDLARQFGEKEGTAPDAWPRSGKNRATCRGAREIAGRLGN